MMWHKPLIFTLSGLMLTGPVLCGPEQLPLFVAQAEVRAEVTRRRIVVLPFRNLSQQPADNWLSESFSESLMMGLSQSPGLRLIERSEIQAVLKEHALMQSVLADPAQAPQLGQLMGAEYIVVGHFQRIESQLQAQVRLVNVSTGEVASASMTQVRGQMSELFTLQERLARQLLQRLDQKTDGQSANLHLTASPAAHEAYIRGLALLTSYSTDADLQAARRHFEQAIKADPTYALPHAGLAEVYARRAQSPVLFASYQPDDAAQAVAAARRALALRQSPESYLALSQAYQAQGADAEALAAAEQAVKENPGGRYVRQYLSLRYFQQLQRDPQAFYQQGLAQQMQADIESRGASLDDPLILEMLAFAYLGHLAHHPEQDHSPFVARLQRVLERHPQQINLGVALALMQRMQGQETAFRETLAGLEAMSQNNAMGLLMLGIVLSNMARQPGPESEQTLRLMQRLIELQPELATAYQLRAGLYDKVYQQPDKARPDFARSVALAPERPEVLLTAARFYLAQAELAEAERLLLRVKQLQPAGEPGAEVLFLLAQLEQTRQRFDQALVYYAQAVAHPAIQQSLSQATYRREQASLLAQQQRLSEALQALTPVLQQYPDWEEIQSEYKLYFVQQQLQHQPADARLHNELGQLYIKLNQPEKALKALLQASQLDPRQAVIAYNLGLAHQTLNQVSAAREAFNAALQLDPAYAKARLGLAQLSYQAGELAQAEAELNTILNSQPDYVPALSLLGQLRQQQNQPEAARLLWQRVLDLEPQNRSVRQWLQRLNTD